MEPNAVIKGKLKVWNSLFELLVFSLVFIKQLEARERDDGNETGLGYKVTEHIDSI